jgi:hypothetical protein
MADFVIDLLDPRMAYLYGFLQADGHLYENTRNRGKLVVELHAQDSWIVQQFSALIPFNSSIRTRTRTTSFSENHTSVVWSVHDLEFRSALMRLGFTAGKKSASLRPPEVPVSEVDYFRGILDADGSLGLTANGFPFVSLITASESLASAYLGFVRSKTGCRKTMKRNRRDGVYNLVVFKEDSQVLVECLYYPGCLALPRKAARVPAIRDWQRPQGQKKRPRQVWSSEDEAYILTHSVEESARFLERTEQSIKMKLWRLGGEVTD